MKNRNYILFLGLFCLILALAGTIARGAMPGPLATHWNAQGQADGFGSDFTAIYLFPLIILFSGLLILAVPSIDPLKANVLGFRDTLNQFVLVFAGYMGYIYLLTLAWNLGWKFNMNQLMPPGFAILLYFAGVLMGRAKRNYFIGIRTPWTLANDVVWDHTHARAAVAFKICAGIALLGLLAPDFAVWLLLVPVLSTTAYLLVYSYLEFQRVTRNP